jgi:hypothetical protein
VSSTGSARPIRWICQVWEWWHLLGPLITTCYRASLRYFNGFLRIWSYSYVELSDTSPVGPLSVSVGLQFFCERQDLNSRSQRAIGQASPRYLNFLPCNGYMPLLLYCTWIYIPTQLARPAASGPTGSERVPKGPAWYESRHTSG